MKERLKLRDIVQLNFKYFLCVFSVLISFRTVEFFAVDLVGEEAPSFALLFLGFILDLLLSFILLGTSILIQVIFSFLRVRIQFFFSFLIILLNAILFGLHIYFKKANLPLDETIYLFSWDEIMMIGNFKENVSFWVIFSFILTLVAIVMSIRVFTKIVLSDKSFKLILLTSLLALFFFPFTFHQSENKTESVFVNNRLVYFIGKTYYHFKEQGEFKVFEKLVSLDDFEGMSPKLLNQPALNEEFPLMHKLEEKSEFASHFKSKSDNPPNIVFIIVESLSSDFIGEFASQTGNFMPFLDSLSRKSLYFPNFLSTCQRTFNVLPASLASIPNSTNGNLTTTEKYTPQMSLPMLLDKVYFSRFYCGTDLNYTNMNGYMSNLNTDYLVKNWDSKYNKKFSKRPNSWGFPDGYMFDKSWDDFKTQKLENKPRFDVFLTISTHHPYSFPNDEKYAKKAHLIKSSKKIPSKFKKQLFENDYLMASFAYTDDALKAYFKKAKKSEDYENTIFFIYGDHGSPFYARNQLSKFSVPLVVFSPMLKAPKKIYSVSSQLDLAPTIVNYLRSEYHLNLPKEAPFMGKDLDMNPSFRSTRTLPLLSANGINESMLDKNKVFLNGELFTLKKNFKLEKLDNPNQKEEMIRQISLYENFSKYCFINQKIVPPALYAKYYVHKKKDFIDNSPNEVNYHFLHQEVKRFTKKFEQDEMIAMDEDFVLDPKTKNLKYVCDMDVFLTSEAQIKELPYLIIKGSNLAQKSEFLVFKKVAFANLTHKYKDKSFNKVRFQFEMDLSKYKLKDKNKIQLYLDNKSKQKIFLKQSKTIFYAF